MKISELKQQVISAIPHSGLYETLPDLCNRVRAKLETMQVSESDRESLEFLLDFFQHSDIWLNRIATNPSTKKIEEFLEEE